MNLHISEIISDLVEPLVDTFDGGREVISTEDLIANIEDLNSRMEGWTKFSWWEGQKWGEYEACGSCIGEWNAVFCENQPELCRCDGAVTKSREKIVTSGMRTGDQVTSNEPMDGIKDGNHTTDKIKWVQAQANKVLKA